VVPLCVEIKWLYILLDLYTLCCRLCAWKVLGSSSRIWLGGLRLNRQ